MKNENIYKLESWTSQWEDRWYGCPFVRASWSKTKAEGRKRIKWLNERHERIKKLSIAQGFKPVLI